MKKILLFAVFYVQIGLLFGQEIQIVNFQELDSLLEKYDDKPQIINFWATWCKPCVEELPIFEEIQQQNDSVVCWLVSVDFANQAEKVKKFVQQNELKSKVVILKDKENEWINKVHQDWQGDIPATLFLSPNKKEKIFASKPLTISDLKQYLLQINPSKK